MHDDGYILAITGVALGLSIVVGVVNNCTPCFFISLVLIIQLVLVVFICNLPFNADGQLDILDGEDRDLYRFVIHTPLDEVPTKDILSFKVRDFREKNTHSNGE